MPEPQDTSVVRRAVVVPASVERAFSVFTEGLGSWWPREYTWSEVQMQRASIDPQRGIWFETATNGEETVWGRVLAWEPHQRVVLGWQITPQRTIETDPNRASEIEIRFVSEGPSSTQLELEHRHFERHGEGGDTMRAGLDLPEGWTMILERYASAVTP